MFSFSKFKRVVTFELATSCMRDGDARKIQVTERFFNLSHIHASMIDQVL